MEKFATFLIEAVTLQQIEKILDDNMLIDTGPHDYMGYAEYYRTEMSDNAVTQTSDGYYIFVEYEVYDKAQAKKIASVISKKLSKLLGVKIKADIHRDVLGQEIDETLWYVCIDQDIVLPI